MNTPSLRDRSFKALTRVLSMIPIFIKKTINLFSKRDLVIIAFFTLLGIGGVFAAGLVTLTPTESQGAGYSAVTSCDPEVTINKDVTFDLTVNRYVLSTISVSNVDQRYGAGCGNMIMELVYPLNGDYTYASWTIPSSTITNGVFTFGANNSTGITYRAYTTLNPIDVENSFERAAINIRPATRAVTNGPVYDLLKDNGFTTAGQDASSDKITFVISLSCGTLTVDTTQPGVTAALLALDAPTGYVKNNGTSIGVNGATSAATLGYRGLVANINIVLPWISYAWKSDCTTTTPQFEGAIWNAQPTGVSSPIAWNFSENGHYYQYETTTVTWTTAYTAITGNTPSTTATPSELPSTPRAQSACSFKLFGMCGYFATVQTPGENAFLTSKVGLSGAWLGANDRTTRTSLTKAFKWSDPVAPEYNKVISTGTKCSTQSVPAYPANTYTRVGCEGWQRPGVINKISSSYVVNGISYEFENWNRGEPNNYNHANSCGTFCNGEQALQFVAGGTGIWNDFPENKADTKLGYIVEYGDSTASGEARVGGGSKTGLITWHY